MAQKILEQLPNIELTLLIGQYSQQYYLTNKPKTHANRSAMARLGT